VNTNELTDVRDRDPITGCPHTKYTLCRVEKIEAPAGSGHRAAIAGASPRG
jgi:hypothetical protein